MYCSEELFHAEKNILRISNAIPDPDLWGNELKQERQTDREKYLLAFRKYYIFYT